MKTKLSVVLGGLFLAASAATGWAQTTLNLSAIIPAATGIQLTVTPVNSSTNVFGTPAVGGTTIPFGTLTYNSSLGIYTASNYYAVDIGTTGGAGTPTVAVTYTEGTNPNGAGNAGLGTKSVATFVTEKGSGSSQVETLSSLGKKRLVDLTGTAGELSNVPGGSFERLYIGIWTGNPSANPPDPSNGQPFTNTDVAGTYTGTLTFTVVSL